MSLSTLKPTYIGVDGNPAWVIMICGGKFTLKKKGNDRTSSLPDVDDWRDIECSRSIGDGKYLVVLGNQGGIYIIKNPTDTVDSMLLSIPDNAFPTDVEMAHGILCLPCPSSGPSKKKLQFLTCHGASVPTLWTVRGIGTESQVEAKPLTECKGFDEIGTYTFCATSPNGKIGFMIDADGYRFDIWRIVAPTRNSGVPLVKCLPVAGLKTAMEQDGVQHVAIGDGGWVVVTTVCGPMILFPLPSDCSEDGKENKTPPFFRIDKVADMEAIYVTKDGSIIGFSNPSKTTSETHLYKHGSGADGKPCLTLTESKRWDDKQVKLLLPMPDTNGKVQLYFGDDSTSTWPNDNIGDCKRKRSDDSPETPIADSPRTPSQSGTSTNNLPSPGSRGNPIPNGSKQHPYVVDSESDSD